MRGLSEQIREKEQSLKEMKKSLRILRTWRVQLDHYVDPLKLIPLYKMKKIDIPADIDQWSKKFDFFELNFGGSILVKDGMAVKQLELGILFDPDLGSRKRHAVAYSIFPTNQWREYGGASLTFGLTGDLGFEVPLKPNGLPFGKVGEIGPQIKSKLLLGPFAFNFKKAIITGVGKGSNQINWIIKKEEFLKSGDFETRVVLKVPGKRKTIKARVVLLATVIPPGWLNGVLGRTTTLAPDDKTYTIKLT
jgi:hypothetical protein